MRLSIITVCFNNVSGLKLTAESVISLKLLSGNIEWIVVDGGSSDGTNDFLSKESHIDKFLSERDAGIYDAMNKGISLSTGDYLCFLNSGDVFEGFDWVEDIFSKNNYDVLFCGAVFDFSGSSVVRWPRDFDKSIGYSVPANHQATFYRRATLKDFRFPHNLKICGDYYLASWLYVRNVKWTLIKKIVVRFEVGGVSTFKILDLAREAMMVQRNVLGVSIFKRLVSFIRRVFTGYFVLFFYKINLLCKN